MSWRKHDNADKRNGIKWEPRISQQVSLSFIISLWNVFKKIKNNILYCIVLVAEPPEEPYDGRSLYDRLKEQKMKKDMQYEEEHKLSKHKS